MEEYITVAYAIFRARNGLRPILREPPTPERRGWIHRPILGSDNDRRPNPHLQHPVEWLWHSNNGGCLFIELHSRPASRRPGSQSHHLAHWRQHAQCLDPQLLRQRGSQRSDRPCGHERLDQRLHQLHTATSRRKICWRLPKATFRNAGRVIGASRYSW